MQLLERGTKHHDPEGGTIERARRVRCMDRSAFAGQWNGPAGEPIHIQVVQIRVRKA
jgi:hypothetical protein